MGIKFNNMIVGGNVEVKGDIPSTSGKRNLREVIQTEIQSENSNDAPSLLKSETDEAEELFNDLRVSKYVLDISNVTDK